MSLAKSPLIVAEMSANHLGNLQRALDIVEAAKDAGADAIKVQTWSPGRMCVDPDYTLAHGPWAGKRLADLYAEAFLPWEWHHPIFARARELGLIPFSAAFDPPAVDFLETLGVDRHKVASFELTDLPLIRHMASKGKPMILSTGMATKAEIRDAIEACIPLGAGFGCCVPTVLKCTSAYPADLGAANLRTAWDFPLGGSSQFGLSDHTIGNEAAIVATALGATMIEKHLTLSRSDGGPDAGFSQEPHEFKALVQAVRNAAATLGEVTYGPQPGEDPSLRRSLWVIRDTEVGCSLVLGENVVTARPALGLPCDTNLRRLFAQERLKAGTPLTADKVGPL
jgi:N-acetylneuraminate synthase